MTPDELNAIEAMWNAPMGTPSARDCQILVDRAREDIPALVAEVRRLRALHQTECEAAIVTASLTSFNAGIEKCAAWHEERAMRREALVGTGGIEHHAMAPHAAQDRQDAAALRGLKEEK